MSFGSKLSGFDKITKTQDRVGKYKKEIDKIFGNKDIGKATELLEHILQDSFAPVISRDIMIYFAKSFDNLNNDSVLALGEIALEMIASKNMMDEADAIIRNEVASVHRARKNFADAAKVLTKIKLENTDRNVTLEEKANILVSIAENWFSEDDAVNAEIFINKATHVILDVEDEDINNRYRYCKAKVFDAKRKFVFAAQAYYELSSQEGDKISAEDKLALLKNSITCAILAPVGTMKSRILTTLTKDERSKN